MKNLAVIILVFWGASAFAQKEKQTPETLLLGLHSSVSYPSVSSTLLGEFSNLGLAVGEIPGEGVKLSDSFNENN